MKKIIFLLLIAILVSCGQENTVDLPETTEPTSTDGQTTEALYFTSFDLDVDYSRDLSFEVEYENEVTGIDAEVENDLTGETLTGNAAINHLRPYLEQLTFTNDTADDAIVTQVISAFGLEADYEDFKLDIIFADGTKREVRSRL